MLSRSLINLLDNVYIEDNFSPCTCRPCVSWKTVLNTKMVTCHPTRKERGISLPSGEEPLKWLVTTSWPALLPLELGLELDLAIRFLRLLPVNTPVHFQSLATWPIAPTSPLSLWLARDASFPPCNLELQKMFAISKPKEGKQKNCKEDVICPKSQGNDKAKTEI